MSTPALILFNVVLSVVVIAVVYFAVRAFLRRNMDRMDAKNITAKLIVFTLVLSVIVIAIIQLSVRSFLHSSPPPTVASMMAELEMSAVIPAETLQEAVQENFLTAFGGVYGIDPEPAETAYFTKLLKAHPVEMEQEPYLREAIQKECRKRRIPEETMIRQIIGIPDPAEKAKIRREWIAAGLAAVLESEDFLRAMEPVYADFYAWWTKRHPEFEGLAAGITITDDHEALMEQVAVSLRREILVRSAQQMGIRFEADLRNRGKVISEAKQKKAFALFLRFARARYPEEQVRRMADAIVKENELTDDEVLHCLLLKNRPMSEERLSKIQDIQVRYLTPSMLNEIPPELVTEVQKGLEELSGVKFGQK